MLTQGVGGGFCRVWDSNSAGATAPSWGRARNQQISTRDRIPHPPPK